MRITFLAAVVVCVTWFVSVKACEFHFHNGYTAGYADAVQAQFDLALNKGD